MALSIRTATEADLDRVAECRARCYGGGYAAQDVHRDRIHHDARGRVGDYLLAERDGQAVGTVTSLRLTTYVRGSEMPCQGIAYVGTIKTARRRGEGAEPGVASQCMHAALNLGRERGDVISALMPFRTSYYEHFGYGLVESYHRWRIPLSILPRTDFAGARFYEPADLPSLAGAHQAQVEAGQLDMHRSGRLWQSHAEGWKDCWCFLDEPAGQGVRGYVVVAEEGRYGDTRLVVTDWAAADTASFLRLLGLLGSMKDQHMAVDWHLPADWPVHYLLREKQLPHRPGTHPVATCAVVNRLQVRVLDHRRFLEALHLPAEAAGQVSLAVHAPEGQVTRLSLSLEAGRIEAKPHVGVADVACTEAAFAAVACGHIPASRAAAFGLIEADVAKAAVLDALAVGPQPFCREAF